MNDEWSRYNRAPLPMGEKERFATLNEKILSALKDGPKTNAHLSHIALDYGRRIRDLRFQGHRIDRKRIDGGLNLYTLLLNDEPRWQVKVRVILANGDESIQTIIVHGVNEGLVRNRAQHMATRVKVLESKLLPEHPPHVPNGKDDFFVRL